MSRAVEAIQKKHIGIDKQVKMILAVPSFCLAKLAGEFPSLDFYAQHLDDTGIGNTTGYLVPELAKSYGARGSIINHSEHRIDSRSIQNLVERLRKLGIASVVCARDSEEVFTFALMDPDFIAIEPPELIGSGRAVSKARPELIAESRAALERAVARNRVQTKLLCGAGIVEPLDATKAVELGSEGILVASGIVKAKDWERAVVGLAEGLIAGGEISGKRGAI